jgi:hypothetical protein
VSGSVVLCFVGAPPWPSGNLFHGPSHICARRKQNPGFDSRSFDLTQTKSIVSLEKSSRAVARSNPKETHSLLWWVFCSPGAAVLQLEYLFPRSVSGSFGTARRRNVVWLQFLCTLAIYAIIVFVMGDPKLAGHFFYDTIGGPILLVVAEIRYFLSAHP